MGIEQLIATQAQRTAGPSPIELLAGMQGLQGQKIQNEGAQLRNTAMTQSLDQNKKQRELEFAANIGLQLKQERDPVKKQQIYGSALELARMNGYEMTPIFPQQYDDRAQQMLDVAHMLVYAPKEFEKRLSGAGISVQQKEFENLVNVLRPAMGPDGQIDQSKLNAEQRAAAIKLRLIPGAQGSAAITAATTPGLTQQVAGSESQIQGSIAGAKEAGKLSAQAAMKPEIEAQIAAAKQAVADASKIKGEERSNGRAYRTYQSAMGNLISAMGGTNTGPVAGRLPAMSADAQIAEGAVAAMAPVLKGIFRTAGEGTFTDKDQELLLNMVPTRKDHPEAIKAKVAAIDAIVESKIGGQSATAGPSSPAQQSTKQGGQLMIDANGNKAMVYPDGTFEELP